MVLVEDESHLSELMRAYGSRVVHVAPVTAHVPLHERDAAILRRYLEEGASTVDLEHETGLSRERVCQILRRFGAIELKRERRRQVRDRLKRAAERERDATRRAREERLARALELMRQGSSARAASLREGLMPGETNLLLVRAREHGVPINYGRHRDFSERRRLVRELHAEGLPRARIVSLLRKSDKTINEFWIVRNMPELKFPRGRRYDPHAHHTSFHR